jgi:flagellar export protein FliJ
MKKFRFPLSRVMDWRRTQARIEESKLERLFTELREIDARVTELNEERTGSEMALIAAPSNTGADLAALGAFQRFAIVEQGRLAVKRAECAQRIAAQTQAVVARRRDVRLIEKLKERRLETWRADFGREIDAQAEEAYLAKWNRAG